MTMYVSHGLDRADVYEPRTMYMSHEPCIYVTSPVCFLVH